MRRLLSLATLLAAATFPVLADERMEHAEWVSEFREGTGEASTKDISMAKFGMLCTEDSCRYFYENGINCEAGNNYPIVIATSAGSIAVETVCAPGMTASSDLMRYWFADLPQFNDALMQSDTVGVAFPLSNGQFRISQFLMNGFGEASDRITSVLRARKADREARETAERERRAREAAERARKAQEAAERALKAQEAAERARKAAEQEAADRARLAAEREAAEQEAAERARLAAEQEAAERARIAEEAARASAVAEPEAAKAQNAMPQDSAPAPSQAVQDAVGASPEPAAATAEPTSSQDSASPAVSDAPADAADTPAGDAQPAKQGGSESPRGKRLPSRL